MCHHVDMDIDWEEAITEQNTETRATDAAEPELDAEESPQKAAPPADD